MAIPTFDLTSRLIEYETGELDTRGFLELFAELVRTGQAWEQQGFYELVATDLIESGYITPEGTISAEGYKATREA
jgi:hypothetical protein